MVAAFDTTNDAIFILYQYQDEMMEWSSLNSEVSMDICGTPWKYELPEGETMLHSSIVNGSNVKEPGRYVFLYKDGVIDPAGML